MARSVKAIQTQTLPVRSKLDKKLRRKARHEARQQEAELERVVNRSCSGLIRTGSVQLHTQIERMYRDAVQDMDKRLTLKGKDRRRLNDSEFDVTDAAPGAFYQDEYRRKKPSKRQARQVYGEGYEAAVAFMAARGAA